ncbi:MAG: hypothetical protein AAF329_16610 [Cyanobacteria bacterium P01_A01_bin.17]
MTEAQIIWEYRQICQAEKEKARAQNPDAPAFDDEYYDDTYVPGDPGELEELSLS